MCMAKGAPKKPEYGPCQERHGGGIGGASMTAAVAYYGYYYDSTANDTSNSTTDWSYTIATV